MKKMKNVRTPQGGFLDSHCIDFTVFIVRMGQPEGWTKIPKEVGHALAVKRHKSAIKSASSINTNSGLPIPVW